MIFGWLREARWGCLLERRLRRCNGISPKHCRLLRPDPPSPVAFGPRRPEAGDARRACWTPSRGARARSPAASFGTSTRPSGGRGGEQRDRELPGVGGGAAGRGGGGALGGAGGRQ